MIPFTMPQDPSFVVDDYIFVPGIKKAIENKDKTIKAYILGKGEITLELPVLTDTEREIILRGCLINYYKFN